MKNRKIYLLVILLIAPLFCTILYNQISYKLLVNSAIDIARAEIQDSYDYGNFTYMTKSELYKYMNEGKTFIGDALYSYRCINKDGKITTEEAVGILFPVFYEDNIIFSVSTSSVTESWVIDDYYNDIYNYIFQNNARFTVLNYEEETYLIGDNYIYLWDELCDGEYKSYSGEVSDELLELIRVYKNYHKYKIDFANKKGEEN